MRINRMRLRVEGLPLDRHAAVELAGQVLRRANEQLGAPAGATGARIARVAVEVRLTDAGAPVAEAVGAAVRSAVGRQLGRG